MGVSMTRCRDLLCVFPKNVAIKERSSVVDDVRGDVEHLSDDREHTPGGAEH